MKIAFAFLLTMPGAPFIYYGDEIGMRYVEGLTSVEGGYNRTGSRSPMQWDDSLNAGFSTAAPDKLYIPQDSAKDRPNAAAQMNDSDSLFSEVKRLIAFRQSHAALRNDGEIAFEKKRGGETCSGDQSFRGKCGLGLPCRFRTGVVYHRWGTYAHG